MAQQTKDLDFWTLEKVTKNTNHRFGMSKQEYNTIATYIRTQPSKHAAWRGSVWYMYSNDLVILYETSPDISLSIWTLEGLIMEIGGQLDNDCDTYNC